MYTFLPPPIPPNPVSYRCDSDVLGYAILLLVSLLAVSNSGKLRTLLCRLVWGRLLRCDEVRSDDIEAEEERGRDVVALEDTAEVRDGRIGELEGEVEELKKRYERELENERRRHGDEIEAQKKRYETELKEQKYHYMTKLMDSESSLNTITLKAAADIAKKDKEISTLSNKCRQALDPHYKYPDTITIAMIASWGARRAETIEKKLRKRERALADGSLAIALEKTKKATGDRIRALLKQIRARDERIVELESLVKSLDEQGYILMEMNMDSSEMLARTRRELREQKSVREELEKVVVLKNEKLEVAGDKAWALGVQLREASVETAILKADIVAAGEKYEELAHHHRAAEITVGRLREKVHDVTRGYRRLSKELDKLPGRNHHHWSDGRQAAWLREQIDLELGAREGQEPEEEESACNHVEELAAAATREGELVGRIRALEAEIVVLKQQLTKESNTVSKHTQTEPTPPQPSCNHEGDLAAAAAREGELAGRIKKLESENAVLKKQSTTKSKAVSKRTQTEPAKPQPPCNHKADFAAAAVKEGELTGRIKTLESENAAMQTQLTAKSNTLQTILDHAEALRTQMATELHAKDPTKVTIDECIDQYRNLANDANQSAQTQAAELNKLRVEHNTTKALLTAVREGREGVLNTLSKKEAEIATFQKEVADDKAEIWRLKGLVTSKEAECAKVRNEREIDLAEINRQISLVAKKEEQRLATKAQVTAKIGAELHLAAYLSQQNFRLPTIAAVERDVLSAKAIAQERTAKPYNTYATRILGHLAKCNDDIDKLRSTLQDPDSQPTRKDLRDFLQDSEITFDATKLEQAAPRLGKQVVDANKLVYSLRDRVDIEVANASGKAITAAEEAAGVEQLSEEDEDEIDVKVAEDEATDSLRGEMLELLMKPREKEPQLADEAMAYFQATA